MEPLSNQKKYWSDHIVGLVAMLIFCFYLLGAGLGSIVAWGGFGPLSSRIQTLRVILIAVMSLAVIMSFVVNGRARPDYKFRLTLREIIFYVTVCACVFGMVRFAYIWAKSDPQNLPRIKATPTSAMQTKFFPQLSTPRNLPHE